MRTITLFLASPGKFLKKVGTATFIIAAAVFSAQLLGLVLLALGVFGATSASAQGVQGVCVGSVNSSGIFVPASQGGCSGTSTSGTVSSTTGGGVVVLPNGQILTGSSATFFASLGSIAQQTSQVSLGAVQTQIQTIRDQIQRRQAIVPGAGRPLGFATDQEQSTNSDDSPWQALAYRDSKSPYFKAAPAAPIAAPSVQYAAWGQLFGDHERRTGFFGGADIGRTTDTGGGVGGAYATFNNVFYARDAFVIGVFGTGLSSHVWNNDGTTANVDGGGVGVNAIYISGGFSTDTTVKADFLTIASSAAGVPTLGLTNIVVAPNLNYKFDYMRYWIEPTVGASYTDTSWNGTATAFGFTHGHQWRVQGGARFGSSWDWYGVRVDPVLGLFAYSDVEVQGGTLAAAVATPLVPTDQGKVFGQLTGKLGFDWGRGWTSYVEGEVRGRNQVWGAAGRVGFAYAFQ